ncbi:ABC transporter permease [Haloplasma contractile]|uniref:Nucleoside transport system permease protein n=1 Tax=Haloplasma contractile SSD-17B TaxID=1033810 RepID=U2FRV7_9MOLU|nr:ABC transporter permease [Haloplasma contractile]ERJ13699.1 Nucleoside transport system permease protein [Haloplasma contractile SSD-17B]
MIDLIWDLLLLAIPSALIYTSILLITSLGGLFSERSGVVNIGLEGLMLIGAFASTIVIWFWQGGNGDGQGLLRTVENPQVFVWIAVLIGGLAGGLFAVLHAVASVSLKADQVISGTAINLLATGLTIFLAKAIAGSQTIPIDYNLTKISAIPLLSRIPIIGPLLFSNNQLSTYIVFLFAILVWYIIFKTSFGLRLRSCGEFPQAADSVGISVTFTRYRAVIISGILAGIGGALYMMTITREFSGTVKGLGFLALASLIFGKWRPINVIGATFFFGVMYTLGSYASVSEALGKINLPQEFYNALPFVMTLIALLVFSKNAAAPKALGEPYDPGKR